MTKSRYYDYPGYICKYIIKKANVAIFQFDNVTLIMHIMYNGTIKFDIFLNGLKYEPIILST